MRFSSKNKLLLFIVEDNEMYSVMLDHVLKSYMNYRLNIFTSGEECISNLYMKPDLIILDYILPGINGLDVLKKIKTINEHIPVIILSAQEDIGVAVETLKAGAYDYIVKDKDAFSRLINSINTLMANIQLREELIVLKLKIDKLILYSAIIIIFLIVSFLLFLAR